MSLRTRLSEDMKSAMKAGDSRRVSALRLITAAIRDRDIAARSRADDPAVSDTEILALLAQMTRQRAASARTYEEAGRLELAQNEQEEITVIQSYLPRPLDDAAIAKAIDAQIADLGAGTIRDLGRVMAALKSRYAGQMDFATIGPQVKARLSR